MNKQHNIYLLAIAFILVITSCKKENTQGENCNCPSTGQAETLNKMSDVKGSGFFTFYKYYHILNGVLVSDSCKTHANQYVSSSAYPGFYSGYMPALDSVKINNIKLKGNAFKHFNDTTKQCFNYPKHCEMYGDSILQPLFVVVNYNDYTAEPIYNNWNYLPDSIKIGKDSVITLGSRLNTLNTEIRLLSSTLLSIYLKKELKNSETTVTIPQSVINSAPSGYYYLSINLRNWTKVKWKKQSFYFVTDNRYIKKIKFYN